MIIFFKNLQNDFLSRSNELANKKLYIQKELKQIDFFLNHKDFENNSDYIDSNRYQPKIEIINKIHSHVQYGWETFSNAYEDYYYKDNEIEFTLSKKTSDITQPELDRLNEQYKQYLIQGLEFAKYVLWLKRIESEKKLSKPKQNNITLNHKMLMLYYLGFNPNKHNKTNASEILFLILGLEKNKHNLYKSLSKLAGGRNKIRTKKNLFFVQQLFDKHNLKEISLQIQKDIEELK